MKSTSVARQRNIGLLARTSLGLGTLLSRLAVRSGIAAHPIVCSLVQKLVWPLPEETGVAFLEVRCGVPWHLQQDGRSKGIEGVFKSCRRRRR
jgi:hypothetical protein